MMVTGCQLVKEIWIFDFISNMLSCIGHPPNFGVITTLNTYVAAGPSELLLFWVTSAEAEWNAQLFECEVFSLVIIKQ